MGIEFYRSFAAFSAKDWPLLIALLIGIMVRATKRDATRFGNIPARWRPVFALGIGLVAGVAAAIVGGEPWKLALLKGAFSAVLAIIGHVFGIEVARNGKELPPGPLAKSDRPPPTGLMGGAIYAGIAVVLFGFVVALSGCDFFNKKTAQTALDVAKAACVIEHAFFPNAVIENICGILDAADPAVQRLVSATRTAASRHTGGALCSDAGAQ